MTATEPIDVGADSSAMIKGGNAINSAYRHQRSRPFNITKDGDLWELYLEVRRWRDSIANTTSVTWVKGHAKQKHIDQGITTIYDKAGNDCADDAADHGYSLGDHNTATSVIAALARKHNHYVKAYVNILKMFTQTIKEANTQRDIVKKHQENLARLGVSNDSVMVQAPLYDDRPIGGGFNIAFQIS